MISPYELLVGLALLREKKRLAEVEHHQGPLEAWSALIVMIGVHRCVIRQDEVDEVITIGKLTPVQGMPDWMMGLGYFRGKLLNVIDGKVFFLGSKQGNVANIASRILVIQGKDEWFGIKVDELLGIRHIWSDSASVTLISEQMQTWRGCAEQCIELEGEMMPVLQARQLVVGLERRGAPEPR